MICPNCGNQIPEGNTFCGKCGTPATQTTPPTQPLGTQPPNGIGSEETGTGFRNGDRVIVTHDIEIEGVTAFSKGEPLIIEGETPHPERPDNRYVVSSRVLRKRFQLSQADLMPEPSQPTSVPTSQPPTAVAQPPKANYLPAGARPGNQGTHVSIGQVLASLVIIVLVVAGGVYGYKLLVGNKGSTPADQSSNTTTTEEAGTPAETAPSTPSQPATTAVAEAGIGQPVQCGNLTIEVKSWAPWGGDEFTQPGQGNQFIAVDLVDRP